MKPRNRYLNPDNLSVSFSRYISGLAFERVGKKAKSTFCDLFRRRRAEFDGDRRAAITLWGVTLLPRYALRPVLILALLFAAGCSTITGWSDDLVGNSYQRYQAKEAKQAAADNGLSIPPDMNARPGLPQPVVASQQPQYSQVQYAQPQVAQPQYAQAPQTVMPPQYAQAPQPVAAAPQPQYSQVQYAQPQYAQ